MHIFLSFLFSKHKLDKYVRVEWIKVFDYNYVDDEVIQNLVENKKKIQSTLNKISELATGVV